MAEIALATDLSNEQRRYLETVRSSGDALLTIINDILDFSKIEARKMDLEHIKFDLRDNISDTMELLSFRAHAKGLELVSHIHPDVPDDLVGDPGRLRQIIVNLVGNAIKFTDKGEVLVRVATKTQEDGHVVLAVDVADTGIGLSPEVQSRIFEAFEQADTSTTRQFGGTGLGLSISRQLVELMGGKIDIESELGKGTTFKFEVRFEMQKEQSEARTTMNLDFVAALPVLIVDDNETNRFILQEITKSWGMIPIVTESVDEAIQAMERANNSGKPIKLILTDMYMPQRDGFELIEHIRGHEKFAGAHIIVLSSGPTPEHRERAKKLSVAAYLTKPFRQSALFDAITDAMHVGDQFAKKKSKPKAADASDFTDKLNILLAEDNPVNQQTATIMLQKLGHTVTIAGNGVEALEKATAGDYDLVFMDIQMPEMDGLTATGKIREKEQETSTHVPVVAMTAHAMKGDQERCLEAGMDDYISKPIRRKEVAKVIARVAEKYIVSQDSPEETNPGEVLDQESLMEELDDDLDMLETMLEIFERDAGERMPKIREAISSGDANTLNAEAHALKGGSGTFFATATYELANQLETMGRENDLANAEATFSTLEKEVEKLKAAIQKILADG
jgi:two-component system, sensor histidine kinase and response regulator